MSFVSNKNQIQMQLVTNLQRAAAAVGTAAVGKVVSQMQNGYGKPIRITGDLMRDVHEQYETTDNSATVTVGNGLEYAVFVHEGTSHMSGRPYIKDGIMGSKDELNDIWSAYLKEGFT